MSGVFFSIIIPTYNRGHCIAITLQSILQQSFSNFEILVIDDGSTDNTENVIQNFRSETIRYYKIENSERGFARNYGSRYSTGEYLVFFDSDDLFLPCLESLYQFLLQSKKPPVVYGDIQHVEENGEAVQSIGLPYQSFTKNLLYNNFMACGAVFLRHDIAQQFPFHEDRKLSSSEDWELWLRVHASYNFIHFPGFIFQQVHHALRSLKTINPEGVEIRDSYFASIILKNKGLERCYTRTALRLFVADRFTFIALCWCGKSRTKAFYFWMKAILSSILVTKRKRFWAVLKKLFF